MTDTTFARGEMNPISAIVGGLHPNNTVAIPQNERALACGLIKFRAGTRTDAIGIFEAQSPWHVPWVWNEFVVTYAPGHFMLHVAAARFPTTWWYVNSQLVRMQVQAGDTAFPHRFDSIPPSVDVERMQIYSILASGVPSHVNQMFQEQLPNASNPGPVVDHPYTVKQRSDDVILLDSYLSAGSR